VPGVARGTKKIELKKQKNECDNSQGKAYADLPNAFKFFIEAQFRTIDVDGNIVFIIYSNFKISFVH